MGLLIFVKFISLPGHGFKLAPAVGKAVAELVLNKPSSYDMKPFAVSRFETTRPMSKL
jgi:glycine/D-amino acid oxidase-like deaminating enzyme